MGRHVFENTRCRMQRLSDLKFIPGWCTSFRDGVFCFQPGIATVMSSGDEFSVELFAEERVFRFRARGKGVSSDVWVLNVTTRIESAISSEHARFRVYEHKALVNTDRGHISAKLVDISVEGVGIETGERLVKGELIDFTVAAPDGLVNFTAEVRYSRALSGSTGRYRSGLKVLLRNRVDKGRWHQVLESAA